MKGEVVKKLTKVHLNSNILRQIDIFKKRSAMYRFHTLSLSLIIFCLNAYTQDRLVIDDRANLLTPEVEELIKSKLSEQSIEYTTMVDFKAKCEYYFTELTTVDGEVFLTITDCNNQVIGSKSLGSRVYSTNDQERSFLLSYTMTDIISEPGKYLPSSPQPVTSAGNVQAASLPPSDPTVANEHDSRYFFAPSAFNLKQGELYYNSVYFFLHDIQYGISDNFSMGMGTSLIGLPIYFTPKLSFRVGEKSAIAIGDMLMFGTYGTDAIGNLLYSSFSTGGPKGNSSFGLGYLATNKSDIVGKTSSLVFNLSAVGKVSPYIHLLTENYLFGVNTHQSAWRYWEDPATGYWESEDREFTQKLRLWYGVMGFRIINKNKDYISWQIGLTYVVGFSEDIPREFINGWETDALEEFQLFAFPAISYTRKFGKKY